LQLYFKVKPPETNKPPAAATNGTLAPGVPLPPPQQQAPPPPPPASQGPTMGNSLRGPLPPPPPPMGNGPRPMPPGGNLPAPPPPAGGGMMNFTPRQPMPPPPQGQQLQNRPPPPPPPQKVINILWYIATMNIKVVYLVYKGEAPNDGGPGAAPLVAGSKGRQPLAGVELPETACYKSKQATLSYHLERKVIYDKVARTKRWCVVVSENKSVLQLVMPLCSAGGGMNFIPRPPMPPPPQGFPGKQMRNRSPPPPPPT
nr:splicing factor 3A subunit 2-like [Tanacetum cinerariifolium]